MKASAKDTKEWFSEWFGKDYLSLYSHRSQEEADRQVDFVLSSISKQPEVVLDIACGAGRHLRSFKEKGIKAQGVDLSSDLLAEAKGLDVQQADMRSLPFEDNSFDLVVSMFTSFGYFDTKEDHINLLKEWARVTKKEGYLFIDYLNPEKVKSTLVPRSEKKVKDKKIIEKRSINNGRVEKIIEISSLSEDSGFNKVKTYKESVMLFSVDEIKNMLYESGYKVCQIFGGIDRKEWSKDSERTIVLAQKI